MKRSIATVCLALAAACHTFPAFADDIQTTKPGFAESDLPDVMKPWAKWVMADYKPNRCPFLYNNFQQKYCVWPGELTLSLTRDGGEFSLRATLYDEGWLPLPGNGERWPQQVKADKQSLIVSSRDGRPQVFLKAGTYTISGNYHWNELPEMLPLPMGTGIVHLNVSGNAVAFPAIDADGSLWVKRKEAQGTEAERTDVKVFRHVTDSIPVTLDTRLVINVSGKPREVTLGKALLDGFTPMDIQSDLPARLEPDGHLKLQVRPGTWQVTLRARHNEPLDKIGLPKENKGEQLAKEEIWVVQPVNYLRIAQIEGVQPIDPSQTELPGEWRGLPAYYMQPGATMTIVEKKRGNSEPAPDSLSIAKEWWLDYDGQGYTVSDRINGQLSQSWRMEVQPGVELGRAAINGRDQFITKLAGKGAPGIEVRPGPLDLDADSRIEKARDDLSAVGWAHDFQSAYGTLHLPPGWSLFHATGADGISDSWVKKWTLLDIFMVMIVVIVIQRLYSTRVAILAAPGFVLLHHTLHEVTPTALIILAMAALLRVVPSGKFREMVVWIRRVALLVLLIAALPFMVMHMRLALFPQLGVYENTWQPGQMGAAGSLMKAKDARHLRRDLAGRAGGAARNVAVEMDRMEAEEKALSDAPMPAAAPAAPPMAAKEEMFSSISSAPQQQQEIYQYDPGMQSNTGFGLSSWHGNTITVSWNGPVTAAQSLHLWLLSPEENLLLAVLRVLLLAYIIVVLLGIQVNKKNLKDLPTMAAKAFAVSMAVWIGAHAIAPAHADDLPTPQMLDEMKRKLTTEMEKPPTCLPQCASVPRAQIDATGESLSITQEVHASAPVSVPLPGPVNSWRPDTVVLVDGNVAAPARAEVDGYLYVQLDRGVHQLRIAGRLPQSQDTVNIAFPLKPQSMSANATGWEVQGIQPGGANDGSIQLIFTGKREKQQEATLEKNKFPAFVQVERVLNFGLSWQVVTTVRRLTPAGDSIAVEIPLLNGETITSADVPVKNQKAYASLGPQVMEKTWSSQLTPRETLRLKSPKVQDWPQFISGSEVWRLNISNLWHVSFDGIPSVKLPQNMAMTYTNAGQVVDMPSFAPWPGETLTVKVTRPEGVKGQTVTVDHSRLEVKAGERSLEATLDVNLRASQGGQQAIKLPQGAVLSTTFQNGAPTSLSTKDGVVTLPLVPGSQTYKLIWNMPKDVETVYQVPPVDLTLPSVNAETGLTLPTDRWVLFAVGPQMGPAVLFWGAIPVILLCALALGSIKITPLRFEHWFLLLLGLTQTDLVTNLIVAGWLLMLGWRKIDEGQQMRNFVFNLRQVFLGWWTVMSVCTLFSGIETGLLGSPNMRIQGNGSSSYYLQWYQDIVSGLLPQPVVLSLPMFCYRGLMLIWALWLAFALVGWLQWGWKCFSAGGYWRGIIWRKQPVKPAAPTGK